MALLPAALLAACAGTPPVSEAPSADEVRRLVALGSGSNIAVTAEGERVAPRELDVPAAYARAAVLEAERVLPRWKVEDASEDVVWLTRTTRVFRFVDDVYVLVEPLPGGRSRLVARSASRVGKGDLGQNARNLKELWHALDVWIAHHAAGPHGPVPPAPPRAVTAAPDRAGPPPAG